MLNTRTMLSSQLTVVNEGDTTRITGKCIITKEKYSCAVPTAGLESWLDGELIQNAMPTVSADDREFLKSGISPTGWEKAFG